VNIIIRTIEENDYPAIKEIFTQGIETKNATFEKTAPEWNEWNTKKLPHSRLAAIIDDEVVGWAALSVTSQREVYRGVNEVSIYVSPDHTCKGIGRKLLEELVKSSEQNGVWTLTAVIFPENTASIKLHKSLGFREIGYMEKSGCMDDVWRDNMLFERRSKLVGL